MKEDLIVLKFGGSLITEKTSTVPKAKMDAINQIANKLKNSTKSIIIVHGAGSYGHPIAKKHELSEGLNNRSEQKKAIDETRKQVYELNQLLCSKLEKIGIKTKTVIPSETMKTNGPKIIEKFPVEEFNSIIQKKKIPVTLSLIHISEPTRPERIGEGGVGV